MEGGFDGLHRVVVTENFIEFQIQILSIMKSILDNMCSLTSSMRILYNMDYLGFRRVKIS